MCAVAGSSPQNLQGLDAADAGQVDVHQDHLRLVRAGQLDAERPVHRAQQADVGAPRDELLDQLQVGRVVLHVEQGAQRRVRPALRPGQVAAGSPSCRGRAAGAAAESSSNQNTLPTPTVLSTPIDAAHQFDQPLAHHQADAGALLGAVLLAEPVERLE